MTLTTLDLKPKSLRAQMQAEDDAERLVIEAAAARTKALAAFNPRAEALNKKWRDWGQRTNVALAAFDNFPPLVAERKELERETNALLSEARAVSWKHKGDSDLADAENASDLQAVRKKISAYWHVQGVTRFIAGVPLMVFGAAQKYIELRKQHRFTLQKPSE